MAKKGTRRFKRAPETIHDILSDEEQRELHRQYKEENNYAAFKKLVSCNLRLAYKIADDFNNERFREDLREEAVLALMFAIEKWNPARGKLTTIATPIIKQRLTRFLIENSHALKIPYLAFRAYQNEETDKDYSPIINARYFSSRELERDKSDISVAEKMPSFDANLQEAELIESVKQKLEVVDTICREVFELHTGLHWHYDVKTSLEQLGRLLNLSKNKLKTKIARVLEYIKDPPSCKGCGKSFFRKNKKHVYCNNCRKYD